MKLLLLLILISLSLHGDVKQKIFELYQNKNYKEACSYGFKYFDKFKKDEKFVSLYGFSCLNIDFIDRLSVPITILKHSEESRANASYFSTILLQKKILYHSLMDNYDISSLNLPTTDYILSKVFDLYTKRKDKEIRKIYLLKDTNNDKITYKLYMSKSSRTNKMVIEELNDSKVVKKHLYW